MIRPIHYTRRHYHETAGGPTYAGMTCDGCGLVAVPVAPSGPAIGSRILAGPVDDRPVDNLPMAVCPVDNRPCGRGQHPP